MSSDSSPKKYKKRRKKIVAAMSFLLPFAFYFGLNDRVPSEDRHTPSMEHAIYKPYPKETLHFESDGHESFRERENKKDTDIHAKKHCNLIQKNSYIVRTVRIEGREYKINIDSKEYFDYKSMFQPLSSINTVMSCTMPHLPLLKEIIDDVLEIPTENREYDAQKILDFVHNFLYIEDIGTGYVKTPIETIAEGGGDCEDLSVLAYSLMEASDIDSVYIMIPIGEHTYHLLVGVAGDFKGAYVFYDDKKYYLAETTGTVWPSRLSNWKIGQLPQKEWLDIDDIEVYKHDDDEYFSENSYIYIDD